MNNTISVLSKLPNLVKELQKLAPSLYFKDILADNDYNQLSKSEIIIADIDVLIPEIDNIKQVKWIQTTWAGVDKFLPYLSSKFESVAISRFSGKHFGRLMSEYIVNNIVNYERNIFQVYENQKQKIWSQNGNIFNHRSIGDLTIGILGIGQIGNFIGQILYKFGAKIWGFGRRPKLPESQEYQHYENYCTKNTLPDLLNKCDYIINVLPSTNETIGLLNGDILNNCCNKNTVFINIGRGSIISEQNLTKAIENKWISAAILDVFENEPLNKDSELWSLDQVFITPHVAGVSRSKDVAEQFVENYNLYRKGEKIPTQFIIGEQY